jgi:hypothetical protein
MSFPQVLLLFLYISLSEHNPIGNLYMDHSNNDSNAPCYSASRIKSKNEKTLTTLKVTFMIE